MKSSIIFLFILQALDPTPFAAFGVVGSLMFALGLSSILVWRLFSKSAEMAEKNQQHNQQQTQIIMDFVDRQRKETGESLKETHRAMQGVADTVSQSHDDLARSLATSLGELKHVINRQSQRLNEAFLVSSVYNPLSAGRRSGDPLDEALIAKIEQTVRQVLGEQQRRDG